MYFTVITSNGIIHLVTLNEERIKNMCENHASYFKEINGVAGGIFLGYPSEMVFTVLKYILAKFGALVQMCMIAVVLCTNRPH